MSVTGEASVQYRRFQGYLDPRLPEGSWFGSTSVVGDASGGEALTRLIFQLASQGSRSSRMFNIERISTDSTLTVAETSRIQTTNMEGPTSGTLANRFSLLMPLPQSAAGPAIDARSLLFLPLFLGTPRAQGLQADVNIIFQNVTTILYVFEAQGYWWGARSVLADGGPQRPPNGIYGA